ncbi:MAG: hypothetical protein AAF414_18685 [Pseudomonadota bacterium]
MRALQGRIALFLAAATGVALTSVAATAQGVACSPVTLVSHDEHREVHFVDFEGDGVSVGDRRIGHRRLFDENDNFVADRMWTVTVHEVDDAGEPTLTVSETVTMFEDGIIFATSEIREIGEVHNTDRIHTNNRGGVQMIVGGTNAYAGAGGTIEIVRGDDNHLTYVYAPECQ